MKEVIANRIKSRSKMGKNYSVHTNKNRLVSATSNEFHTLDSQVAFDDSGEIEEDVANDMVQRFIASIPPGAKSEYELSTSKFKLFIQKVTNVSSSGKIKAVAIQPGKIGIGSNLDFAMETIKYDKSGTNKPTNIQTLKGLDFFGKLASNFSKDYDNIPNSGNPSQQNMNDAISKKDAGDTEIIFVEITALNKFCNVSFDKLLIQFARNEDRRLTVVISRLKNGIPVHTGPSATLGLYLDDHDLLP